MVWGVRGLAVVVVAGVRRPGLAVVVAAGVRRPGLAGLTVVVKAVWAWLNTCRKPGNR